MKKLLAIAALVCAGAGLLTAQTAPVAAPKPRPAVAVAQAAAPADAAYSGSAG